MPRGRHRQTSPLNRLLPPIACGVLAVAALVSAPLTSDIALLRVLVVATAVGAASSAVLLRMRERAGEAELEAEISARTRDEARFEDRIAELEFQAETAEEQSKRLERRLLAQRSQLARAEGDIQRLLRERARIAAEQAARAAEEARRREAAVRGIRPTPTAYLKAASVLRGLERRAAVGQAQRTIAQGSARAVELTLARPRPAQPAAAGAPAQAQAQPAAAGTQPPAQAQPTAARTQPPAQAQPAAAETQGPAQALPAAAETQGPAQLLPAAAQSQVPAQARPQGPAQPSAPVPAAADTEAPIVAQGPAWARAALPPLRPAVSILPATLQRGGSRSHAAHGSTAGTFSFFTRQEGAISTDLRRVPADLADVVGEEAAAAQDRYATATGAAEPAATVPGAEPAADPAAHDRSGESGAESGPHERQDGLVDLTAEDETEPIDVRVLRAL